MRDRSSTKRRRASPFVAELTRPGVWPIYRGILLSSTRPTPNTASSTSVPRPQPPLPGSAGARGEVRELASRQHEPTHQMRRDKGKTALEPAPGGKGHKTAIWVLAPPVTVRSLSPLRMCSQPCVVSHVWSVMLRTRVRSSPPQRCKRSAPAELSCWPSDPAAQVQLAAHQQRMDERILCHVSLGPRNLSEHLYEQLLEALSERLSEHCRSIVGVLPECCRSVVGAMLEQCRSNVRDIVGGNVRVCLRRFRICSRGCWRAPPTKLLSGNLSEGTSHKWFFFDGRREPKTS